MVRCGHRPAVTLSNFDAVPRVSVLRTRGDLHAVVIDIEVVGWTGSARPHLPLSRRALHLLATGTPVVSRKGRLGMPHISFEHHRSSHDVERFRGPRHRRTESDCRADLLLLRAQIVLAAV